MILHAYITRLEEYVEGDRNCLTLRDTNENAPDSWLYVGSCWVPTELVDEVDLRDKAVQQVDEELRRAREIYTEDMQSLQERKDKLLAIAHKP